MKPGQPSGRALAASALVASTYAFFLLFAQFGFIQGIESQMAGGQTEVERVLGVMAIAGITSSLLAPAAIARMGAMIALAAGLAICAVAAGLAGLSFSGFAGGPGLLMFVSVLTGSGLGIATVALAADFRRLTVANGIGKHAGLGTGVAYGLCSLPPVFAAAPATKAWCAFALAAAGAVLASILARRRTREPELAAGREPLRAADLSGACMTASGIACAVAAFLALVWFDSAAFAWVQDTAGIRERVWTGNGTLASVAGVHLLVAVGAGLLIDRGRFRSLLVPAFAVTVAGSLLCRSTGPAAWFAAPVYAAGVSIYSTLFPVFAALAPARPDQPAPAWRAAWLFAVAGWIGSAAGVGLVKSAGSLPAWAAPAAGLLLVASLLAHGVARPELGTARSS